MTALLQALARGAADLALAGHLARDGKGHAEPGDLVEDLLDRLAGRVDRPARARWSGRGGLAVGPGGDFLQIFFFF